MQATSSPRTHRVMATTIGSQKGAISVLYVLMLPVLLGFAALSIDVGSWYVVKAELSKSVDAAAFAGAKNIANPYVDPVVLAQEFGRENFPSERLGVMGPATFSGTLDNHTIRIRGSVSATPYLAKLFGVNQVDATNTGAAKKNKVEIMLVLDRSGSMSGTPISDLKTAATSFVNYFKDTQAEDKVGLISFSTGVWVDCPLNTNFISSLNCVVVNAANPTTNMLTAINNLKAMGGTNAEDGLAQASGAKGLSDQSGVPGDKRVQQFLIFFTDGYPTAFRSTFRYQGIDLDAVAIGTGNNCDAVYTLMGYPTTISYSIDSSNYYPTSTLVPTPTGDGNSTTATPRTACSSGSGKSIVYTANARWYVFSDSVYGITNPTQCRTTTSQLSFLPAYICSTAENIAIDNATNLKNKYVIIYIIGLGTTIDKTFLSKIASSSAYEYYAPTSSQLQSIFNSIAKDITLRLVE